MFQVRLVNPNPVEKSETGGEACYFTLLSPEQKLLSFAYLLPYSLG